jgi:hypothetical protein
VYLRSRWLIRCHNTFSNQPDSTTRAILSSYKDHKLKRYRGTRCPHIQSCPADGGSMFLRMLVSTGKSTRRHKSQCQHLHSSEDNKCHARSINTSILWYHKNLVKNSNNFVYSYKNYTRKHEDIIRILYTVLKKHE